MAKPQKAKSGCFSGFLQVLCVGNKTSPPVNSSNHVTELEKPELMQLVPLNKETIVDKYAATPGVVARLMGLDSLPNTKFITKGSTPDSVPRSRSVNFVDYLVEFDLKQASMHRRMKTSASFREVPALGRKQNHDLVVLYWGDGESRGEEDKLKKEEKGVRELKQKKKQGSKNMEILKEKVSSTVKKEWNQGKNKKISKLKNEPRRVPSSSSSSKQSRMVRKHHCEVKDLSNVSSSTNSSLPNKKKGFVEPKLIVNKRNQKSHKKKIETENNAENLSPVSVLDTNDYPFLYETNFIDNSHSTSPLGDDGVEEKTNNIKGCAYTDLNREAEYYSEVFMKLHTLTEKDIRESNITPKNNEGFEEICLLFEDKILDLLLHEFVDEVVGISS
ncbi:PREDICTED: uncharacterized protein LOC109361589 isoform X2 [Lupinus angustifolius]|uniref:uncharacterized protein LOC109361589 isoform X2 n=1 Tax=Lupinus angustifolius TaxID=3871 RepID=UPI00092F2154|nr:PREDICTED: uncharacterized protein LOC109361589 isoform X2 [Lupinus angustifolius]